MSLTKGKKDYLDLGNWNALCDVCGFKFKASELRKRWDGYMCCEADWEQRHPQDLIRLPKERQAPPWARPAGKGAELDSNKNTIANSDQFVTVAPVDPNSL